MPIETRTNSALFRRAEQLKRWEDSETNQVSPTIPKDKKNTIKFSDGCVFLAACAASDTEEVERLLKLGTDINTANVDGLTALHQACIDNNLEMVQFLVERGCNVNQGDNEGWTPLHATASCGFLSIAKYLIENGANVAAVNNDGDLPIDIAESNEMEEYLSDVLDEQNIDCDLARSEEERLMLEDAKSMLNAGTDLNDRIHSRTGATPLHVAAAKGYIDVLKLIIQIGADLNAQDFDGWTPLHAAAHWGQKEACAILADNLVNMDIQNFAGQTCFDVAEPELVKLLEELKKKQTHMQKDRPDIQAILQRTSNRPPLKRRTSVTRMSGQEKSKSVMKDTKAERAQIENLSLPEEETEDDKERIHTKKNTEKMQSLVDRFSDVNPKDKDIVSRIKEDGYVQEDIQQPKNVPINETKPVPETTIAKEPELERIPSWKRVLRKANADSMEAEVTLKRPKKTNENEENASRTSDVPIKDGWKSLEQLPSHSLSPTNEPFCELSNVSSFPATSPSDILEFEPSDKRRGTFPQARDDESELQRKAHAKRVRETRRSTQGVLLEDLKSAELQYLINTQRDAAKRQADEAKDETVVDSTNSKDNVLSADKSANASWKNSKTNSNDSKESSETNVSKAEESERDEIGSKTTETSNSNETSPSVTLVLKPKSTSSPEDISPSESRSSLGTQAAIQRRRRPKRRSTGVVYLDSDDAQDENSANKENNAQTDSGHTDRARQRYGSSSSIPDTASEASCRSDASSHYSTSSRLSANDEENKEYKKLYEEVKKENDCLKENLKKTEEELEKTKKQLQKMSQERRSLERKISEMEEEVKQIEKLKADNERLSNENKALIRVISKLSK
ncbi:protein phosphatase 1 regulatory subunit 12A isoform X3 [Parasteatoda tepidariorum]|uniref:protein phosphatase 1 regulatory subunit 12A isoform X3 n=1 Tax=Parasteatoda tepidariorum TaxID=114398 RepID=UPI00077FD8C8